MMFCWLGFHKWKLHKRVLVYYDNRREVFLVYEYCPHCKKERKYYDGD